MPTNAVCQPNSAPPEPPVPEQARDNATLQWKFEQPFEETLVKWVVKATQKRQTRRGLVDCGYVLPYVDCRAYSDRLTEVAGLGRWTRKYAVQVVDGVERRVRSGNEWKAVRTAKIVVACEITVTGLGSQTGLGEEWADEENALTTAEAQAFKRACSMFGIGRYLYDLEGQWLELDSSRRPLEHPRLPEWARGRAEKGTNGRMPSASRNGNGTGPGQPVLDEVRKLAGRVGAGLTASILQHTAGVTRPSDLRDGRHLPQVLERLRNAARGVERLHAAVRRAGDEAYRAACQKRGIAPELDAISDTGLLRQLLADLEGQA